MPTVKCPSCGEQFQVVIPEEMKTQSAEETDPKLTGSVVSWNLDEDDPTYPYTGSSGTHADVEQRVEADVRVDSRTVSVTVWYTPHAENWDYFKYAIRGPADGGQKTVNVYDSDDGLFVKNRATPWTSGKKWTYLSPKELKRRSRIAGLGEVIEDEEGEGGYGLLLDLEEQPLVTDEELAEDFVVTLTKALLVMKSRENPAG